MASSWRTYSRDATFWHILTILVGGVKVLAKLPSSHSDIVHTCLPYPTQPGQANVLPRCPVVS